MDAEHLEIQRLTLLARGLLASQRLWLPLTKTNMNNIVLLLLGGLRLWLTLVQVRLYRQGCLRNAHVILIKVVARRFDAVTWWGSRYERHVTQ